MHTHEVYIFLLRVNNSDKIKEICQKMIEVAKSEDNATEVKLKVMLNVGNGLFCCKGYEEAIRLCNDYLADVNKLQSEENQSKFWLEAMFKYLRGTSMLLLNCSWEKNLELKAEEVAEKINFITQAETDLVSGLSTIQEHLGGSDQLKVKFLKMLAQTSRSLSFLTQMKKGSVENTGTAAKPGSNESVKRICIASRRSSNVMSQASSVYRNSTEPSQAVLSTENVCQKTIPKVRRSLFFSKQKHSKNNPEQQITGGVDDLDPWDAFLPDKTGFSQKKLFTCGSPELVSDGSGGSKYRIIRRSGSTKIKGKSPFDGLVKSNTPIAQNFSKNSDTDSANISKQKPQIKVSSSIKSKSSKINDLRLQVDALKQEKERLLYENQKINEQRDERYNQIRSIVSNGVFQPSFLNITADSYKHTSGEGVMNSSISSIATKANHFRSTSQINSRNSWNSRNISEGERISVGTSKSGSNSNPYFKSTILEVTEKSNSNLHPSFLRCFNTLRNFRSSEAISFHMKLPEKKMLFRHYGVDIPALVEYSASLINKPLEFEHPRYVEFNGVCIALKAVIEKNSNNRMSLVMSPKIKHELSNKGGIEKLQSFIFQTSRLGQEDIIRLVEELMFVENSLPIDCFNSTGDLFDVITKLCLQNSTIITDTEHSTVSVFCKSSKTAEMPSILIKFLGHTASLCAFHSYENNIRLSIGEVPGNSSLSTSSFASNFLNVEVLIDKSEFLSNFKLVKPISDNHLYKGWKTYYSNHSSFDSEFSRALQDFIPQIVKEHHNPFFGGSYQLIDNSDTAEGINLSIPSAVKIHSCILGITSTIEDLLKHISIEKISQMGNSVTCFAKITDDFTTSVVIVVSDQTMEQSVSLTVMPSLRSDSNERSNAFYLPNRYSFTYSEIDELFGVNMKNMAWDEKCVILRHFVNQGKVSIKCPESYEDNMLLSNGSFSPKPSIDFLPVKPLVALEHEFSYNVANCSGLIKLKLLCIDGSPVGLSAATLDSNSCYTPICYLIVHTHLWKRGFYIDKFQAIESKNSSSRIEENFLLEFLEAGGWQCIEVSLEAVIESWRGSIDEHKFFFDSLEYFL